MTSNPAQPASPVGLQVGDKLDRYTIAEQIGAGGTSVVWKGHDPLLAQSVAIKQLLPGPGDLDAIRERFRTEAQLHKRVSQNHRHIVKVIDFLDDPRGLFIIMEFVAGASLEGILAAAPEPFDERRALGVVAATAVALQTIHEMGVLHRDLKPSNILLPRKGGLKISDFGLATLLGEQDLMTLGTVRYMAPELFGSTPADERADLYSLGMIAYEMLAGRAKFDEAFKIILRDQRNQGLRWMKWHTNLRVQAPPLRQLNPAVSQTLADLVARLMEKDPTRRPGSAAELLSAIRRHFVSDADAEAARSLGDPEAGAAGAPGSAAGAASGSASAAAPTSRDRGGAATASPRTPAAIAPSQNPTAPLPRRSRLTLILACILVLELAGGAAFYFFWTGNQRQAQIDRRKAAIDDAKIADDDYRAGRMDIARDRYLKLAQAWPNDRSLGLRSKALALMAQAQIDIDAGQYDAARVNLEAADATGAFRDNRDQIQALKTRAANAASAAHIMQEIRDLADRGEFAQVNKKILGLRNTALAPEQAAELKALEVRVADQASQERLLREVNITLEEARKLVLADKRDDAIKLLEENYRRLRAQPLRQYAEQLTRKVTLENLDKQAKAAQESGDLKAAIDAYARIQSLQPADEIASRLQDLRSQAALEEGKRLLEQGDQVGAAAAFERSIQARDNPEAKAALSRITATQKKEVLARAGDDASAAGDLDAAVKHYQGALALGPDDAINAKIVLLRVRRELRDGLAALEQDKPDAALSNVKNARALVRTPELRSALESQGLGKPLDDLDKRAQYRQRLLAGDAFRGRSRFPEAKAEYRKAREIMSTKEVNERLDDAEYAHLVAQARVAIGNEQWALARGQALAAGKIRPSDEVKALLREIDSRPSPAPRIDEP